MNSNENTKLYFDKRCSGIWCYEPPKEKLSSTTYFKASMGDQFTMYRCFYKNDRRTLDKETLKFLTKVVKNVKRYNRVRGGLKIKKQFHIGITRISPLIQLDEQEESSKCEINFYYKDYALIKLKNVKVPFLFVREENYIYFAIACTEDSSNYSPSRLLLYEFSFFVVFEELNFNAELTKFASELISAVAISDDLNEANKEIKRLTQKKYVQKLIEQEKIVNVNNDDVFELRLSWYCQNRLAIL